MGLFGNQSLNEFRNKYTETCNIISQYSFGTSKLPESTIILKINANLRELKDISKRFANPYNESFTFYTSSVFGNKITIAEGLLIINTLIEDAFTGRKKISINVQEQIIQQAHQEIRTSLGRFIVTQMLNS